MEDSYKIIAYCPLLIDHCTLLTGRALLPGLAECAERLNNIKLYNRQNELAEINTFARTLASHARRAQRCLEAENLQKAA